MRKIENGPSKAFAAPFGRDLDHFNGHGAIEERVSNVYSVCCTGNEMDDALLLTSLTKRKKERWKIAKFRLFVDIQKRGLNV